MTIKKYVTKWGVIRHSSVCKDDYENLVTDTTYQHHKGAPVRQREYKLTLQQPAMRSFHAAEKYLGYELKLTGSIRTCALQKQLYDSDPQRYAHPNSTLHTQGLAIDVHTGLLNNKVKNALLDRGWKQSRPVDEPWHFSFRLEA